MIEQIGTSIVMFLLGSALTYFLGKWSQIFSKIDNLELGVQALLRDRMLQMHKYYAESKKPIPQREVESFESMYDAYEKNDGNSYMKDVRHVVVDVMPHEPR